MKKFLVFFAELVYELAIVLIPIIVTLFINTGSIFGWAISSLIMLFVFYLIEEVPSMKQWKEHKLNTIKANEQCDQFLKDMDNNTLTYSYNGMGDIYLDFDKARKVIDSMTFASHTTTLKYVHQFSRKWNNKTKDKGFMDTAWNLRKELDRQFDEKYDYLIRGCK